LVNTKILAFATQGAGGNDETRLKDLLSGFTVKLFAFKKSNKLKMFFEILKLQKTRDYDLFVMEGTGLAGGLSLIVGYWLYGTKYCFSSGDAIGPFLAMKLPIMKAFFNIYERLLCKNSSGFIGWSPYFVGRAITLGARRGITAAGWNPHSAKSITPLREKLGLENKIVIGIIGSINWNPKTSYCYGKELVEAAAKINRADVSFLIVGDGSGRKYLERIVEEKNIKGVIFTGFVEREKIGDYLALIDVGSLPQSIDEVGLLRYTTKISEYLGFSVPFFSSQTPLSYDFGSSFIWRVKGRAPWLSEYTDSLSLLIDNLSDDEIKIKKENAGKAIQSFSKEDQIQRMDEFIHDVLSE
tara:strand:- start:449 stop:1513 length:1065 start_codon:yes stop_codon:yes gene_type:complete